MKEPTIEDLLSGSEAQKAAYYAYMEDGLRRYAGQKGGAMQAAWVEELAQVEADIGRVGQAVATADGALREVGERLGALTRGPMSDEAREQYRALLTAQQQGGSALMERRGELALLEQHRTRLRQRIAPARLEAAKGAWATVERDLHGILEDARWLVWGNLTGEPHRTLTYPSLRASYQALQSLAAAARQMQGEYNALVWDGMPQLGRSLALPESFEAFLRGLLGEAPVPWLSGLAVPAYRRAPA